MFMMIMMMMMTMTMMMTMLMILPFTVKILSIEMNMKGGLNEGTLRGTLWETLMTMRYLTVVNLMKTILLVSKTLRTQFLPTHLLPYHFFANTWANMVDPSNIEILFVSTWGEGMNLCKGLAFTNKVEVKHALTICALKENKYFMISRSTIVKLCAKCVDELCKWYVVAVMKPNLHRL